jgi:hypothetical protein
MVNLLPKGCADLFQTDTLSQGQQGKALPIATSCQAATVETVLGIADLKSVAMALCHHLIALLRCETAILTNATLGLE